MLKINSHLLTDVGLVRKANEDCFGEVDTSSTTKNGHIFIVCDGMGGHVGGAVASQMAVDCIIDYFNREFYDNIYLAIEKSISYANNQIFLRSQTDALLKGMGTTCTVLVHRNSELFIGHLGDSRIYIQTDGKLSRLTKDHSYVQTLVDKGEITDAEMELHPRKNELTQALGVSDSVNVDVCSSPILAKVGDKILMCSDGLCGFISDSTISQVLNTDSILKSNNALVSLANNAGGGDNITVGLIEILESPHNRTIFESKNNVSNIITSTQEVKFETTKTGVSFNRIKPLIIGLPLFVLVFCLFYIKSDNSPKNTEEVETSEQLITKQDEIITEEPIDETSFEWTVDSIYTFGDASAKFQSKFSSHIKNMGKSDKEIKSHIQNYAKFNFNDTIINYQEAKTEYYEKDISIKDGVFTVIYFDAHHRVQSINSPLNNKNKEVSPTITNVDKGKYIDLQKRLSNEGYYTGNLDGDYGPMTKKAEKDSEEDKARTIEIAKLKNDGWKRIRPKFGNINPIKFNGKIIDTQIPEILIMKLEEKTINFQLPGKDSVVLYRSSIKVKDVNGEIKSINKQINKNDKIAEVSFAIEKKGLSYALVVDEVLIGYYNYTEKEDTIEQQNKNEKDQRPTDGEESEEEGQEELDK